MNKKIFFIGMIIHWKYLLIRERVTLQNKYFIIVMQTKKVSLLRSKDKKIFFFKEKRQKSIVERDGEKKPSPSSLSYKNE